MSNDFDSLYGSKYLSAADLRGEQKRVTIDDVTIADFRQKDGSSRKKVVLTFGGEFKPMVVNKTNAAKLAQAFGKKWTGWVGNAVELYTELTPVGEGIRIRVLRKPATVEQPDAELNDAVPF
jgi:hypothetical protein